MKRFLKWAGVVLLLLAGAFAFLLRTSVGVPEKARFALDLAALRAAAGPEEGLPESVRAEEVARAELPLPGAIVGGEFRNTTFAFYCWQVAWADGSTAVIEAVHTPRQHAAQYQGNPYRQDAWERQEKALLAAKVIAVTHEHHDHIGGISDAAQPAALAPKLKLTAAQRRKPPFGAAENAVGGEATLDSGPEGSIHPIAPGMVAITAAGHTPGSQMIYLRLKGGRELLLIGDIAWQQVNLTLARTRPRLVSLLMGEDATAVANQLRAILDLQRANPSLDVVVSHDVAEMERRFQSGAVARGLR